MIEDDGNERDGTGTLRPPVGEWPRRALKMQRIVASSGFDFKALGDIACPACGRVKSKVVDTRGASHGRWIRRRRECMDCEHRFSSYECVEHPSVAADRLRKENSKLEAIVARLLRQIDVMRLPLVSRLSPSAREATTDASVSVPPEGKPKNDTSGMGIRHD